MASPVRKLVGLLRTRAHAGGALYVLRQAAQRVPVFAPVHAFVEPRLDAYSDRRAQEFDARYGVETFDRMHLSELDVGRTIDPELAAWKYGPVNPDFFDEILERLALDESRYTFVDVGAGKGMGILRASEGAFAELVAVEFAAELVAIGERNVARYAAAKKRSIEVRWVCEDFMAWALPDVPTVLFFNNPFPADISVRAVEHVEAWLAAAPRDAIVVYRKIAEPVSRRLDASPHLEVVEWSPYWRAYATPLARDAR